MFITVSGEFAALNYLRNIYLLSVTSPLCCVWAACTALTADWLLPGSVCNQSDAAVGDAGDSRLQTGKRGCIRAKITRFEIYLLSAVGLKKQADADMRENAEHWPIIIFITSNQKKYRNRSDSCWRCGTDGAETFSYDSLILGKDPWTYTEGVFSWNPVTFYW